MVWAGAIRKGFQGEVWVGLYLFPQPTTLHGFLLVLTVHLNHHHQAALGFASEWVTGHLKRS